MTQPTLSVKKSLLQNCLSWFQTEFRQAVLFPIESQFPSYPLPSQVQSVLDRSAQIRQFVEAAKSDSLNLADFVQRQLGGDPSCPPLFKQIVLRYRRHRAAYTEGKLDKTFHPELIQTLEEEIKTLDAMCRQEAFQNIVPMNLPRAKDFLPVQYLEQSASTLPTLAPRQYDEKFHILQAPALFLPDLAYLRAKCEMRDTPLAVAFLDIDDFKRLNEKHSETIVDRNLLPRLMQTLEAHVYHHGYAYRQGGDEYLILLPSLSRKLAIEFLDELRSKVAGLKYPDIEESTTVSIGLCIAEPDCPLTDRELRDRANEAKKFAKKQGKNCIAIFEGPQLVPEELRVVRPQTSAPARDME
ncbi:MAG TPA: GGDEF domain-containing protein [Gemmataceae bacterium]|nr:GGDEF domain-containing protein [Gemmataceae bacterium]